MGFDMRKGQVGFSRHEVIITEHEKGWGSKVDEVIYFDTEANAQAYVKDFNSFNTRGTAPDWYMVAGYNFLKG